MENVIILGKLLSLWVCFLLLSILFLKTQTSYRTYKIISSNELARPVMGTIFSSYMSIAEHPHYCKSLDMQVTCTYPHPRDKVDKIPWHLSNCDL